MDSIEWSRLRWSASGQPEPDHFAMVAAIMRLHQIVVSNLDRLLKDQGLSRTAYLVLATLILAKDRTLTMSQLSRRLILHPTTISLVTDQLQARGLVERQAHAGDRRTVLAALTEDGVRVLTETSEALAVKDYGLDGINDRLAITVTETIRQARVALGDT
jgi:DNA-binding MarR family transcriptional regulator